jgi:hypothetical protein
MPGIDPFSSARSTVPARGRCGIIVTLRLAAMSSSSTSRSPSPPELAPDLPLLI